MIAVLQFDAASLSHLEQLREQRALPSFEALRRSGTLYRLGTAANDFEGAAAYSLYTGTDVGEHGLYYPWLWSAREQRVRFFDDFPAPEAVWERIGHAGLRSLVIDPYEIRPPQMMRGIFASGWQFKNRVVLRTRSVPAGLHRWLEREFGRPPVVEEVYGRPAGSELLCLKNRLVAFFHKQPGHVEETVAANMRGVQADPHQIERLAPEQPLEQIGGSARGGMQGSSRIRHCIE